MNGVDISSARNQDLRNVHIRIDEYGNVFITAPHYQISEQETFTPLSSYKHSGVQMEHRPAEPLPASTAEAPAAPSPAKIGGDSALAAPVPAGGTAKPPVSDSSAGLEQPAAAKAPR